MFDYMAYRFAELSTTTSARLCRMKSVKLGKWPQQDLFPCLSLFSLFPRYEDKCETKYETQCETQYDSVCRDVQVTVK